MYFEDLRLLLLEKIRRRVHNGELTERGLARLVGISQPHMHNVLKGTRMLSTEMADRILYHLRLSVLDLCDPREFEKYVGPLLPDLGMYSYLPVLKGRIGPNDPWPTHIEKNERFPVPQNLVASMSHPVVCRLGEDEAMHPLFGGSDFALLDQSPRARAHIAQGSLYLIKRGRTGLVRRVRQIGAVLYMYPEQRCNQPSAWEELTAHAASYVHFVRARVTLIAPGQQWQEPA